MRFAFVEAEKESFSVSSLCRAMRVSRSGFYAWRDRPASDREKEDLALAVEVRAIHAESRGVRGSPGIHGELRRRGRRVGRKRVARLMRENKLAGVPKKRFRKTTNSEHHQPVAPHLLAERAPPSRPDEVWVADLTYVRTWEGWLYTAVIVDLYSRRVVGWASANHMRTSLPLEALRMAIGQRRPPAGLIHHSDRGSQYASKQYRRLLTQHGIVQSMSRRGNCYDNAYAESFIGTLKIELIHRYAWPTRRGAADAILNWFGYYNSRRGHSALSYLSPIEFEKRLTHSELAA